MAILYALYILCILVGLSILGVCRDLMAAQNRTDMMCVTFATNSPQALLDSFNARIGQSEPKGKITTWVRSKDKIYYTHKSVEWNSKAWFKPSVENGKLLFNIIKPKDSDISVVVYGYYHGHLTETFLNHFDENFSLGYSSALPTSGDFVSA